MKTIYLVMRDHGTVVRAFTSNDKANEWANEQGKLIDRAWFYVEEVELDEED